MQLKPCFKGFSRLGVLHRTNGMRKPRLSGTSSVTIRVAGNNIDVLFGRLHVLNTLSGVLMRPNTAQNIARGVKPLHFSGSRRQAFQQWLIVGKSKEKTKSGDSYMATRLTFSVIELSFYSTSAQLADSASKWRYREIRVGPYQGLVSSCQQLLEVVSSC